MEDDTIYISAKMCVIKKRAFCTVGRRNWWSCWLLMEGKVRGVCVYVCCVCMCVVCVCVLCACTVVCSSNIFNVSVNIKSIIEERNDADWLHGEEMGVAGMYGNE